MMNEDKIKELMTECIRIGINKNKLNYQNKLCGLHINCEDNQLVRFDGEKYYLSAVNGTRFVWLQTFANAKDMAQFIFENISEKTYEEIENAYDKIASALMHKQEN